MERIKDTIENLMRSWEKKKKGLADVAPEELLKKHLSKKEQQHIKFSYFKKGVIGINVDSSSWLYKLSLEKDDLLASLRKASGAIKDIRFRIGEIR